MNDGNLHGLLVKELDWDKISSQGLLDIIKFDETYIKLRSDRSLNNDFGSFERFAYTFGKTPIKDLDFNSAALLAGGLSQNIHENKMEYDEDYSKLVAMIVDNSTKKCIESGRLDVEDISIFRFIFDEVDKARKNLGEGSQVRRNLDSIMENVAEVQGETAKGNLLDVDTLSKAELYFKDAEIKNTGHRYTIELRTGDKTKEIETISKIKKLFGEDRVQAVDNMIKINLTTASKRLTRVFKELGLNEIKM